MTVLNWFMKSWIYLYLIKQNHQQFNSPRITLRKTVHLQISLTFGKDVLFDKYYLNTLDMTRVFHSPSNAILRKLNIFF